MPSRSRLTAVRSVAVLALVSISLSACTLFNDGNGTSATEGPTGEEGGAVSSPPTTAASPPAGVPDPANDPALSRFYDQRLSWKTCYDDLECADLVVPLDWADPDGKTIEIAVARSKASGNRVGSLVFNPGGPGVPMEDYVVNHRQVTGPALDKAFDFVGMDPRGVGESAAVECLTDAQKQVWYAKDASPDADTSVDELVDSAEEYGQACEDRSGELLPHVDTLSAARDLDVLRAALGEPTLTFWGASYGTYLGAWYAETFPWRVGRFVLDGAVDPALTSQEYAQGQLEGFNLALENYLTDCLERDRCPLRGSLEDAKDQLGDLVAAADTAPLRTDQGRALTQSLMVTGIIQALYVDDFWPALTQGLTEATQGEGTMLLRLADNYLEREENGSYGPTMDSNAAINCADHPETRSQAEIVADSTALAAKYSPLGNEMAWQVGCLNWPVEAALKPTRLTAEGAAPIVVIGGLNDPATPYRWAQGLADQLSSAVLLTFTGEGHTAFRRGSSCIDDAVEDYLIAGTVPEDGTRCAPE